MKYESTKTQFSGPLFIVGMPRSGTKLLRSLLNKHPRISIPAVESEFLPYWIKNWKKFGSLSDRYAFKNFYSKVTNSAYFFYMKEKGNLIEENFWYNYCKNYTVKGIYEALIRHDAAAPYKSNIIWGDKSPSYIRYLPLLKANFPKSRFIHIVRDARDYCLSINKAWNKNMLRAAQRWYDDITKLEYDSKRLYIEYLEIRYEDLIVQPVSVLKEICIFLNIPYSEDMSFLSKPSENLGDAKGLNQIRQNNFNKYKKEMDEAVRRKIEDITWPLLVSHGYQVTQGCKKKHINRYMLQYYQVKDGINLLKFYSGVQGWSLAIKSMLIKFMQKMA